MVFSKKEEFWPEHVRWNEVDGDIREIYFLPGGEPYWCFRWTKGYLISQFGIEHMKGCNPYTIEEINGKNYMFLWLKERDYFFRGGKPTLLILEQVDALPHTKEEIRLRDPMLESFTPDPEVLGSWKVCDFVRSVKDYIPGNYHASFSKENLFFKRIEFRAEGKCTVQYGDKVLESPVVNWSAGIVQEPKAGVSQKYERRILEGTEFLFIEFKSGDYFYNHQKPWLYVFTRKIE